MSVHGWSAKKYTNKGGYKSEGKYTKPRTYIFTALWKDVGVDEAQDKRLIYMYDTAV